MKKKQQTRVPLPKIGRAKKKTSAKVTAARKTIRAKRPIHKRVALQPITILVLICVGVLLCGLTLRALAATVTTNAVVPAPPLTQPAGITDPTDGYQTATQAIIVSGTCPSSSYVNLSDNNIFIGSDICASGAFQISLDLTPGSNQLQAQDYNITNAAGPVSSPIVVIYTPPTVPPASNTSSPSPVTTPTQLVVLQDDTTVPYTLNQTPVISSRPTLAGIAPPYSHVIVVIHSNSYTCTTTANGQGYWSCTLPDTLSAEIHTVDVTAITPQGKVITLPPFKVQVLAVTAPQLTLPSLFHITSSYLYSKEAIEQPVSYTIDITGGRAPYAFTIDWGDSTTSTIIRQSEDTFTISHTYGWFNAAFKSQVIKVQAVDTTGQSSTLQLETLVRNPRFAGSTISQMKPGGLQTFFNLIRPWLWFIWPGYAIITLLVFSFWLGERQELAILVKNKNTVRNKRAHAHGQH